MKENLTSKLLPFGFFLLFFVAVVFSMYQQFSKPKVVEPIRVQEPVHVIQDVSTPSATLVPIITTSIIRYIPAPTSIPQKESHTETTTVTTNTTTNTVTDNKTNPTPVPTNTQAPVPTPTPTPKKSTICVLNICL